LQAFLEAPRHPFALTLEPEVGLPTPETQEKKGSFALLKRNMRLQKQHTDEPNHRFLIEAVANLARATRNRRGVPTIHMLDNAQAGVLSEKALVLWLPTEEFIEKLFFHASKPFVVRTLCHAYMHHAQDFDELILKLWKTIQFGCQCMEYEHTKVRPYFELFFWLIQMKTKFVDSQVDLLMTHFVKLITANKQFYQWMEAGCDFVWKLYTRIPLCQRWFAQNPQKWEELFSWLDKNRTPPMYASHMPQFA
jgi:hypothetical protein